MKPHKIIATLIVGALALAISWVAFQWMVNRIYVPEGKSLMLRYKGPLIFGSRQTAPPGQFAEPGQIGVLEQLRGCSIAATSIEASGGCVMSRALAARRAPAPRGAIRLRPTCHASRRSARTPRGLRSIRRSRVCPRGTSKGKIRDQCVAQNGRDRSRLTVNRKLANS